MVDYDIRRPAYQNPRKGTETSMQISELNRLAATPAYQNPRKGTETIFF